MKNLFYAICFGACIAALFACKSQEIKSPELEPVDDGNFIIYVSNISELDSVDLTILLDEKVAVSGYFFKEESPKKYAFKLGSGNHEVMIKSKQGNAQTARAFSIKERRFAHIEYMEYPGEDARRVSREAIQFVLYDRPLNFK